ncbi:MAG: hypothetical protein GF307_09460, partial [candidate division Zixibacteria bacterium]|nr:hypothetical protein [candidate division Zixibacteria bacterium]
MLNQVTNRISKTRPFRALVDKLSVPGPVKLNLSGLTGSLLTAVIGALFDELDRTMVVVTPGDDTAVPVYSDLKHFIPKDQVYHLCSRGIFPFQMKTAYFETSGTKLEAMYALLERKSVVVATPHAVAERTVPPGRLRESTLLMRVGEEKDMREIGGFLVDSGYKRVGMVEEVGDFAVRGGLIDIFPASSEYPVRMEFFGDEIDSIRKFSVSNQRSLENIEEILLLPRREFQASESQLQKMMSRFTDAQRDALEEALLIDDPLPGLEWLAPVSGEETSPINDYLPGDSLVIKIEPEAIEDGIRQFIEEGAERREQAEEAGWPLCSMEKLTLDY